MEKRMLKSLIETTLKEIGLYSKEAVNLLLGTAAQESRFYYIKQLNGGPARSIFQIEPRTHDDHVNNYLSYREELSSKILSACGIEEFDKDFLYNTKYAICIARIHYLRVPQALPSTINGMAAYWKQYYNTYIGSGTEKEFIKNYMKYVKD